jgi:5-methylthioribose kinase
MRELDSDNIIGWLREHGHLPADAPARAESLSGGVSNVVLRIHTADGPGFVVKQSRERLRTEAAWFSRLDRIWREADAMRDLGPLAPPGFVPRVLFEDSENYEFRMQAVPDAHVVWKGELLAGRFDAGIARRLGAAIREIHRATSGAGSAVFRERYADREVFDQLRIDPFYRRVAERHTDLRPRINALIDRTLAISGCLVHGDLSPKNLLVTRSIQAGTPADPASREPPQLTLVDYEVAHYGDPAFDVGFLLSHCCSKPFIMRIVVQQ